MTKITLYTIDPEKYFNKVVKILKLVKKDGLIYVTTNKTYDSVIKICQKNKIDPKTIFFIDCISKQVGIDKNKEPENCLFLESPQSLTSIGIAISQSVNYFKKSTVLFLDSLSTLLIYNDAATIYKFSNFLFNKMRSEKIDTIILALESDIEKDIIKQIQSLADEVRKA